MSATKKQTAVEWLIEEIEIGLSENGMKNAFKKAKAMEKEQIMDAYKQGESDGYKQFIINIDKKYQSAEQYYNETYETI